VNPGKKKTGGKASGFWGVQAYLNGGKTNQKKYLGPLKRGSLKRWKDPAADG